MVLKSTLIEPIMVKAAKFRCQPAESSDKSELGGDLVTDETEPNLPRKLEPILGLTLHLRERISRREKVRDQVVAAVCRKGKVTDPVGGIEGATYQIAASLDMSRPWQDDIAERHI